MRFAFLLFIGLSSLSSTQAADKSALASYRAVYDLTLAGTSTAPGLDAARGRIVLEFSGNECEGYALSFRQVMDLTGGEAGRRVSDLRTTSFEEGAGKSLRFRSETRQGNRLVEETDGTAERSQDQVKVTLRKPKASQLTLKGNPAFPTQHLKELISEARKGSRTYNRSIYDGSDDSQDALDTFALIGAQRQGADGLEADLVKAGWADQKRWPVSISYFEPGETDEPSYKISYELFENGFGRALKLEYSSFAFIGTLTKLDPIATKPCP
jgi:EipB-like